MNRIYWKILHFRIEVPYSITYRFSLSRILWFLVFIIKNADRMKNLSKQKVAPNAATHEFDFCLLGQVTCCSNQLKSITLFVQFASNLNHIVEQNDLFVILCCVLRMFIIDFKYGIQYGLQLGEKGSGIRSRGDVQDFNALRNECLEHGILFEDPEFPANDSSLFYSTRPDRHIEWRRPSVRKHNCCLSISISNRILQRQIFDRE